MRNHTEPFHHVTRDAAANTVIGLEQPVGIGAVRRDKLSGASSQVRPVLQVAEHDQRWSAAAEAGENDSSPSRLAPD